jgi:pimeloyl-ACP methyl ester carboxylesterase
MLTVKSTDGVSIAYSVAGSGSPALVFVHGWCCDRSYWDAQVPYFLRQYQVVTVDLAGHGESGLGRSNWATRAFADDVVAVVKELDLKHTILIGHSIGGNIIVEAALKVPKHVIGLVGVDTFNHIEPTNALEQAYRALSPSLANFSEVMRTFVRSFFTPNSDPVLAGKITTDMSSAPPEVGLGVLIGMLESYKQGITKEFKEVKAPILSINCASRVVNLEMAKRYAPSFEVKYMQGVGHFVMMEDPATFNRLLDETVKEIISRQKGVV